MSNTWVAAAFACVLHAAGVLGLVQHGEGTTSSAPAYNVFHLVSGAAGLALVVFAGHAGARAFNIGFGLVDLYQALASRMHWFPHEQFCWKPADDALHVVFGVALVGVGLLG